MLLCGILHAQETTPTQESLFVQTLTMQGSLSSGKTPLWLNANKHGLSALTQANGYMGYEASATKAWNRWKVTAGMHLVAPIGYRYQGVEQHYTSHLILQEAFAEATYKHLQLTLGAQERELTLRDNELSSGSQTFGKNARPVPQLRLGMGDFWDIPGLNHWLGFKGHLSFGIMTDGGWEEKFVAPTLRTYNTMTRYHEKAGYLRLGKERHPLSVTLGLEMASEFGGYLYNWWGSDQDITTRIEKIKLKSDLKSYKNALLCSTSGDVGETQYQNNEGNLLGSWVARMEWNAERWTAGIYYDHFFEDHSSLIFLDKDGYGTGDEWDKKKEHRFFVYKPADLQVGIDLTLKEGRWIRKIVAEYLNTTYQSGPIYHDHNQTWQDHISGIDKYYNHSTLPGWQHWGQVIGHPFYLSPLYNNDGQIGTAGNRFRAFHLGLSGKPASGFAYRCLLSYEKNWGTYDLPYVYPKETASLLLETTTSLHLQMLAQPILLTVAYGQDLGKLMGNNYGLQLTLKYSIL